VLTPFVNEPFTDFTKPENRAAYEAALAKARADMGRTHRLLIDGKRVATAATFDSRNPCKWEQVLATFAKAGAAEAETALDAATRAFSEWSRTPAAERAGYLLRAAAIMRRRKHEFSAVMTYEVAKTWAEADGDTAEAIDFMEFYAREMLRIDAEDHVVPLAGEWNSQRMIPLGVCAVIPPWNFPLAILVGMTTAAIVAGNTVVLKPASDSAWIASKFIELMEEVRLPAGVLNFVPGGGGDCGETIVRSPKTRLIAFTGSKEVGLHIHETAAKADPKCKWIKRTVLEMGGKDAILVDEDFDAEEAATYIVQSAFGFQGQKCSACSRAIIHDKIYDEVARHVVAKTKAIKVGDAADPATQMSAVVNAAAHKSIMGYVEAGKTEGVLLAGGVAGDPAGWFIEPTVVGDVKPEARIHCEEIFGPVLALLRCRDFDDGLRIVNATEFGLTGAVLTRNRKRIEKAKAEFHAGNLYINRKCTGALVGVHPFGGFNMSGTDSKAGGFEYLSLFLQAKSISERL
jgi:1-pyrroline-5-carboxylate dehydrogenase